jgi:hypothetical protein
MTTISNLTYEPKVVTLVKVDRTKSKITLGPRETVQILDKIILDKDLTNKIRKKIITVSL